MESKRNKQNSASSMSQFQVRSSLFDNEMIALAGKNGANISKQMKREELIKWVFQSTDLKCIGDKEAQIRFGFPFNIASYTS
jgi:hypothetical protein